MSTQVIPLTIAGRIRDADVLPDGTWAAVVGFQGADYLSTADRTIELGRTYSAPLVRLLDHRRVVIVDPTPEHSRDENGMILPIGSPHNPTHFHAGTAVADVVVTPQFIACTFRDEGVTSREPVSVDGIAIFNHSGRHRFGYLSRIADAVDVLDCYAACATTGDEIAFLAYPSFRLVTWNLLSNTQALTDLPKEVVGAQALAYHGSTFYFHAPYRRKHDLFQLAQGRCQRIGEIRGPAKAIRGGRFLSFGARELVIHKPATL